MHWPRRKTTLFRIASLSLSLTLGSLYPQTVSAEDPFAQTAPNQWEQSAELTAEQVRPQREVKPTRNQQEPSLDLFYMSADWHTVLKKLAEQTNRVLVMPEIPSGRFRRLNTEKLTPVQALRILNTELQPKGFQILPKGQYLIVIKDETLRPKYSRPPAVAQKKTEEETPQPLFALQPAKTPVHVPLNRGPQLLVHGNGTAQIQQMSMQQAEAPATQVLVIEPKFQKAIDLAQMIYKAYGTRARLVEAGPGGFPAFEVNNPGEQAAAPFQIGIDAQGNRLLIKATVDQQKQFVKLLTQLDQAPNAQQPTKLMPSDENTSDLKDQLPKVVNQINKQEVPNEQAQPATANMDQASTAEILDRMRSNVNIESLEALGLLVLRGNQTDLDAVEQVIARIEQMSMETTPQIHLRNLAHVDSEPLAELLNSIFEGVSSADQRPSRQTSRVNVSAVVQPNAILIVAPKGELEGVLEVVEMLDQPVDPRAELRVFPLKHAAAQEALTLVQEFYNERPGLGTNVRSVVMARTNSLVVQARPNELAEIVRLVNSIDKDVSAAVSRVEIIELKHAVAEELAEFLNQSLEELSSPRQSTGTGQGNQNQNSARSVALEFITSQGEGQKLIRSGLLTEVRITADPRTNSLSLIAPEKSLPMFRALIDSLDRPSAAVSEVKVFTLQNADASSAAELLTTLFETDTTDSPVGVNLSGTTDAGSALLPMKFTVDIRSNSIVAIGGPDALTLVEAILLRLDAADSRKRQSIVVRLKNAPAASVADAINQFVESQRELDEIDPDLVSNVEVLEREVIVVADDLSNNLLISATPTYFGEIQRIVAELDRAPEQVIIQALLVEVELDNTDEFGVELGFQDSILFDRSLSSVDDIVTVTETVTNQNIQTTTQRIISQAAAPGYLFNNPTIYPNLGNNVGIGNGSTVGGQGLSNFGVGRVNGDLGFGGLVLSASSESISVLIRALSARRNVHILSRPQIRTVDSQTAQIQVGQEVPIVQGVTISNNIANPNIEYDEAGIILTVTPRINPEGQIVMEVVAEKSAYRDDGVPVFTDVNTGNIITSPIKDVTVARTTVGVTNGQTIVLGGMITKNDTQLERKVPLLGDIPILGHAFRFDSISSLRTELLIFLTPRVINGDADNEYIKEIEACRLNYFVDEAEAIHGPLFAVPGETTPWTSETGAVSDQYEYPEMPVLPQPDPETSTPSTIVPEGALKLEVPPANFQNPQSIEQASFQRPQQTPRHKPNQAQKKQRMKLWDWGKK